MVEVLALLSGMRRGGYDMRFGTRICAIAYKKACLPGSSARQKTESGKQLGRTRRWSSSVSQQLQHRRSAFLPDFTAFSEREDGPI